MKKHRNKFWCPLNKASFATLCIQIGQSIYFSPTESVKIREESNLAAILLPKRENMAFEVVFKELVYLKWLANRRAKPFVFNSIQKMVFRLVQNILLHKSPQSLCGHFQSHLLPSIVNYQMRASFQLLKVPKKVWFKGLQIL